MSLRVIPSGFANSQVCLIWRDKSPTLPPPIGDEEGIGVVYDEIPQLITDLRRAYNAWKISQEQSPADGVVAAILLQSHVAQSPGDFS